TTEFAHAQQITVYGTVQDKANGIALDSAWVNIRIPKHDQNFLAFTNSSGQWEYTFQLSGIAENEHLPTSFSLSQNYPNPFNPSTRIPFSIARGGEVTITVYNVLGQELDSKRAFFTPGNYFIGWNSKGGSGVLFYSIEMENERQTRKMLQLDGGGNRGLGQIIQGSAESESIFLSKTDTISALVTASKLGYEPDSTTVALTNETQVDFQLDLLHSKAFVVDLHNDVLEKVVGSGYQLGVRHSYNHSDIPRFFEGGVDAQMFVVWVDHRAYLNISYQRALQFFDAFDNQVALNPTKIAQARNADEIFQVNAQQKLAGVLVVEGGHAIENDLDKLKELYRRGMRYLTITWNNSTDWATSAEDSRTTTRGLSDFGKQVIRTLDSLGVIIDVSHVGIKTIQDILATSKNPIIASHSDVRALRNHYRNLYDDQIVAIANSGGVIGVVFYPYFLSSGGTTNISTVIKHINYIVNLVGIDHVAIGSDYDGIESTPIGLEDVSKLPALTMALLKAGYSNANVKKILGENFLRVFREVCH
ncbi:MAG TPA: membrane dipeptidase, partial [bacterium]